MATSQQVEEKVKVSFPSPLDTTVSSRNGVTSFTYSKAIHLKFDEKLAFDYLEERLKVLRRDGTHPGDEMRRLAEKELDLAVMKMLARTLPGYFGDGTVYRGGGIAKILDNPGIKIYFFDNDGLSYEKRLQVTVDTKEYGLPVLVDDSVANPTFTGGTIKGFVGIDPRLNDIGLSGEDAILPILKSLMLGRELDLTHRPSFYRDDEILTRNHVGIENPTLERMRAGREYAMQVEQFFSDYEQQLEQVAQAVVSILRRESGITKIRGANSQMNEAYDSVDREIGETIPRQSGLEQAVSHIRASQNRILELANVQLRTLRGNFPTGLAEYLPATRG